jgi:hypothetical protein
VVKHSPHHPKIEDLSLAKAAGTGREEMMKAVNFGQGGSTVVEHLPYCPMVECFSQETTTGTEREKMMKSSMLWT